MLGSGMVKQLDDPRGAAREKLLGQLKAVSEFSGVIKEGQNVKDDTCLLLKMIPRTMIKTKASTEMITKKQGEMVLETRREICLKI